MSTDAELKILLVEDNEFDLDLTLAELKRSGLKFQARSVDQLPLFEKELRSFKPEIVISDFSLPGFNAFEVLATVQNWDKEVPVIVVTGALDDETAVECLKRGAADYLLKGKIIRLRSSIERALELRNSKLETLRYQRDLMESIDKLKSAKNAADIANKAKSLFLANMSHEMRTPLSAMTGFSELLLAGEGTDEERRVWTEKIHKNCERLRGMIDEILDLSKVEAGKVQLDKHTFKINEMMAQVQSLLNPQAIDKNLKIDYSVDGKIPAQIYSDPIKLRHVLTNIIGNAIKFSSVGPISVVVKENDQKKLSFIITDKGRGISAEEAMKLFEPFTQADNSMTRKFGGTGLGLALARKFAVALGGDVRLVKSELGKGSSFEVTIDPGEVIGSDSITSIDTVFETTSQKLQPQAAVKIDLAGLEILLVEDSKENQFLVKRFLEGAGASVEVADNGEVGCQKAQSHVYDLVFMDIQMPVLDGFTATLRLRSSGYDRPIVALTAHALKEERERCLKAGFTSFLTKPINRSEILKEAIKYKSQKKSEFIGST
jgi:signal transduction histidine kinase